jgi:hypothetical protein
MPHGLLPLTKSLLGAAASGVVMAGAFFLLFATAAIFAPQDQQAIRQHLIEAITSGEFSAQTVLGPTQTFPMYRSGNDCFILSMMLAPAGTRPAEALSNRVVAANPSAPDARAPPFPPCQALLRALPELGGSGAEFVDYDRYVLGMRVLGRVLLSVTSLKSMRQILAGVSYALLALIAIAALWRLVSARNDVTERIRAAGYLAIAVTLALFYGVNFFDAMLNFGPLDDVHFVFILVSLLLPLGGMRPSGLAIYAGSYGSLIAIFEFFSGGIPLSLALLPLLLALGYRGDRYSYLIKLITLWSGFCAAVIATFAIKKVFTILFLGDSESFFATLLHRTYGGLDEVSYAEYSLTFVAQTFYRASALVGLGSSRLGASLVLVSLAVIIAATWRNRGRPPGLFVPACWLALSAVVIWYAVFLNHAILHASFMARLLIVPIIAAAVLIAVRALSWRAKTDDISPVPMNRL